jgi:hypothetical protein
MHWASRWWFGVPSSCSCRLMSKTQWPNANVASWLALNKLSSSQCYTSGECCIKLTLSSRMRLPCLNMGNGSKLSTSGACTASLGEAHHGYERQDVPKKDKPVGVLQWHAQVLHLTSALDRWAHGAHAHFESLLTKWWRIALVIKSAIDEINKTIVQLQNQSFIIVQ